jgi:CMP-N,N'-diacetyllegionaminic acid synthase
VIGNKHLLAIIPARGGSKRLPRKNVLDLSGLPLIAWTINAALSSKYIDRVIVSTDDPEIARVSEEHGAEVPFLRPEHLSTDQAASIDAIFHSLEALECRGDNFDFVILLQPTSPLRNEDDIDGAVEQLIEKNSNAVISICKAEHHPLWCNTLPHDLSMADFLNREIRNIRSQDLPVYYRLNGAIYLCSIEELKKQRTLYIENDITAYIMPQDRSVDIDGEIDLVLAKMML